MYLEYLTGIVKSYLLEKTLILTKYHKIHLIMYFWKDFKYNIYKNNEEFPPKIMICQNSDEEFL